MTIIDNVKFKDSQLPIGDLPEGWDLPRISHLIEINYGKGLKEADRELGPVSVYGSNGIVGSHNTALTKGPSIIIGRKGSVGAVHYSPTACWPIDTTYYVDKFNGLNPMFLMYALRLLNLADLDTSTAIPGLNRNDVYSEEIPLPPINEQKRIVAKVEELLARVNATKDRLTKVSLILKRFRQAVLAAACSGRLTTDWREENVNLESEINCFERIQRNRMMQYIEECDRAKMEGRKKPRKPTNLDDKLQTENVEEFPPIPSTWIYIPLARVVVKGTDSIVDGPFGTSVNVKEDYIDNGIPVVRINNIRAFSFLSDDLRFVLETKFQQLKRHDIIPGDVLLTKVGTIGESCVFPSSYEKALLSTTGSCRIRVDRDLADNKYICIYLNSIKNYLNSIVSESVQPFLNMSVVKNLSTALPTIDEQHEIVRRVESMFKLADAVEKRVAVATTRTKKLTQAVLAKAFRGELVPIEAELARREGRSYEPASELLARIKSA
jgi:type I restriction enzyme S subunit